MFIGHGSMTTSMSKDALSPTNLEVTTMNILLKRWSFIQSKCNKLCGEYEHIKPRHVSGIGVKDMVRSVPSTYVNVSYCFWYIAMHVLLLFTCIPRSTKIYLTSRNNMKKILDSSLNGDWRKSRLERSLSIIPKTRWQWFIPRKEI
jgi:hypothetical protein